MSTGAAHNVCAGCAKDADSIGHKVAACKADMCSAALVGSAGNMCVDCTTHIGKLWLDVAVWLKTCEGMAGGSDSLKERVLRIKNFLGTVFGDEAESMVA
ncbi:hypothetical protein GBA52_009375 [Prunus armeniaca]|nr:hypothetical protein GBA52_009375 [Prunus armeniaca]